jgi:hypothetical protein
MLKRIQIAAHLSLEELEHRIIKRMTYVGRRPSCATTPKVKASVKRFAQYKEMLAPLMALFTERGRLPIEDYDPEDTLTCVASERVAGIVGLSAL